MWAKQLGEGRGEVRFRRKCLDSTRILRDPICAKANRAIRIVSWRSRGRGLMNARPYPDRRKLNESTEGSWCVRRASRCGSSSTMYHRTVFSWPVARLPYRLERSDGDERQEDRCHPNRRRCTVTPRDTPDDFLRANWALACRQCV